MVLCEVTSMSAPYAAEAIGKEKCKHKEETKYEGMTNHMEGTFLLSTEKTSVGGNSKSVVKDYSITDKDGDTILMTSIIMGDNKHIICGIIDAVADVTTLNIQNYFYRQTALHLAVIVNTIQVVEYLLRAGASRDIQDHNGNTPLHIACMKGSLDIFKVLTDNFGNHKLMNLMNFEGYTCLHLAAKYSDVRLVEYMIRNQHLRVDINMEDERSGRTILHKAVENKDLSMAIYLVQMEGINIDAKCSNGHTPLCLAAGYKNKDMVRLLLSVGADKELMYTDEMKEIEQEKEIGLYID